MEILTLIPKPEKDAARKVWTNVADVNKYKTIQQNASRPNSTAHRHEKVGYIDGM